MGSIGEAISGWQVIRKRASSSCGQIKSESELSMLMGFPTKTPQMASMKLQKVAQNLHLSVAEIDHWGDEAIDLHNHIAAWILSNRKIIAVHKETHHDRYTTAPDGILLIISRVSNVNHLV